MGIKRNNRIRIVVILGPTAAGKSSLAVKLAKRFNGEVVSADSRQVYKGMDIGSGKITYKEMEGIPHHLLSVANPKRNFSASRYKRMAEKEIITINKKGNLPIICGGTPFYIKALTDGLVFPKIRPDSLLRKRLERKSADELYEILQKIDPKRAETIERKNKRRLIRAIEINSKSNQPVPSLKKNSQFSVLKIGIRKEGRALEKAVKERLLERLKRGMVKEVKDLRDSGISFKRLESFGLEYRWIARYLQNKVSKEEMIAGIIRDTIRFSKKQMTWFKKDEKINWVKGYSQAVSLLKDRQKNRETNNISLC